MTKNDLTLLGRPVTPEEKAEQQREQKAWDKAREIVIDGFLDGYRRGELTLDKLCRYVVRATKPLKDFPMLGARRQQLVGAVIEHALTITPQKRGRGNRGEPTWIRKTSVGLVQLARQREKLPVNRDRKAVGMTAFERVSEIWKDLGVTATPAQVEKWCYPPKRNNRASPKRSRTSTTRKRKAVDV